MKFCPNCGHKLEDDAEFCINCGTNVGKREKEDSEPKVEKSSEHHAQGQAAYQQSNYQQNNYNNQNVMNSDYSPKSKIAAGVLNIFLAGVGNLYLGHVGKGLAQLLLNILGFGIGGIWSIIDGILILCSSDKRDGQGRLLK